MIRWSHCRFCAQSNMINYVLRQLRTGNNLKQNIFMKVHLLKWDYGDLKNQMWRLWTKHNSKIPMLISSPKFERINDWLSFVYSVIHVIILYHFNINPDYGTLLSEKVFFMLYQEWEGKRVLTSLSLGSLSIEILRSLNKSLSVFLGIF